MVGVNSPSSQAIEGELFINPNRLVLFFSTPVKGSVSCHEGSGVSGARAGRSMRAPSLLLARKNPCLCLQLYSH